MSILLLSEIFPPATGGSGRWLWEVYRCLPRDDVYVIAGEHHDAQVFDAAHDMRLTRLGLTFSDWGLFSVRGWRQYGRAYRVVKSIAQQNSVTQIHCGRCLPEGWLALRVARKLGIDFMCYVHGEELNTVSTSRQLRWMTRRVFNGAKRIITNSRNTADIVMRDWRVGSDKIAVLHPGVDTKRFVPGDDGTARKAMGWHDRRVVLTVSRLQKRKGHDRMIQAIDRVRRMVPNVLYAIVGDGHERERLERLVDEYQLCQHVRFYGEVSDEQMIAAYQGCDVFVLANRLVGGDFEGFGMVLTEAQACGKPVVAGDSGGTAETMIAGETGLIVDATKVDALGEAVVSFLTNPERGVEMGKAARDWGVEQFEWNALVEQAKCLFAGQVTETQYNSRLYNNAINQTRFANQPMAKSHSGNKCA